MRNSSRIALLGALACLAVVAASGPAVAQPVKNRISVMVDSSGSMLLTPEIVTFSDNCTQFNPCNASGDISTAAESCNACVRDTIRTRSSCASNWTGPHTANSDTCADRYESCVASLTGQACTANMTAALGISTRGDGSAEYPGCDLNGDGIANESRMFQAKEAIQDVTATFGEVEFALWRFEQYVGGNTCTGDGDCQGTLQCENHDGNNGTPNVCAYDADRLDGSTTAGMEGQCDLYTFTGSPSTFTCASCTSTGTTNRDRETCDFYDLDQARTGATSRLDGMSTVNCYPVGNEQHRFIKEAGTCNGGEQLVTFPATGFDDNYAQIFTWIDHSQPNFSTDLELRPQGGTPIAATLQDMRASIFANAQADTRTPCRKHTVVFLTDGDESCNTVAEAVTAAQSFQNMSFTNAAGTFVADYDVPVYMIGFAICAACQSRTNLNMIAAAGGTGQAIFVNNQLELQLALAQIVAGSVVSERCNNLDDDCDVAVDEDFPGKGTACSAGVGACQRNGQMVCTGDQLGLQCSAVPGMPSPEVCNGIDDNCNGLIDDGINCGGCNPVCSDAAGCDICNGIDEDCDMLIDEDFSSQPCGVSTGECSPGVTTCTMGVLGCSGGQGPTMEVCDNQDDDCDGIVDGMTQPCYPAATPGCNVMTGVCQGICRLGSQTCEMGMYGACSGARTPGVEIACNGIDEDCDGADLAGGPEQCNGLDDDCDGRVDEGVAVTDPDIGDACGTPPFTGACRQGTIQCVAGAEQCVGEIDPSPEACNNIDDDCDGPVDEGAIPGFGGACGSNVGRCSPGTLQCVNGGPQCVGQTGPFAEVCNNLDDNCNGATDETDPNLGMQCNTLPGGGTVASQTGECRFGVLACQMGGLTCVGAVGPTAELCDGRDNDCDGMTDEDFPLLGTTCNNGQPGVCRQNGTYVCAPNGMGVTCTAPPGSPGTETCNNLDDDCDTMVDEAPLPLVGEICAPGTGVCAPGRWACTNGMLVCPPPSSGNPEVCNAADDDCDSLVDESPPGQPLPGEELNCVDPGFGTVDMNGNCTGGACDVGECEFGQTVCTNGGIECDNYVGPSPEICDGLDNDCDGNADNMATCPNPNNVCQSGECVVPCAGGEFPCPAGYVCQPLPGPPAGNYCVPDPCVGVQCQANEVCDPATGGCRDLCQGVMCRAGEECRLGFCLDCFDLPDTCDAGELCVADGTGVGQCVDNPCDPNPCAANQTCNNGECTGDCSLCASNEICVGGTCVPDRCDNVNCGPNQVCDPETGGCTGNRCEGVACQPGQVCVPTTGDCIADPCATTMCPSGDVCTVDPAGRPVCGEPGTVEPDRVTAAGGGCGDATNGGAPPWLALALLPLALRRRRVLRSP